MLKFTLLKSSNTSEMMTKPYYNNKFFNDKSDDLFSQYVNYNFNEAFMSKGRVVNIQQESPLLKFNKTQEEQYNSESTNLSSSVNTSNSNDSLLL